MSEHINKRKSQVRIPSAAKPRRIKTNSISPNKRNYIRPKTAQTNNKQRVLKKSQVSIPSAAKPRRIKTNSISPNKRNYTRPKTAQTDNKERVLKKSQVSIPSTAKARQQTRVSAIGFRLIPYSAKLLPLSPTPRPPCPHEAQTR